MRLLFLVLLLLVSQGDLCFSSDKGRLVEIEKVTLRNVLIEQQSRFFSPEEITTLVSPYLEREVSYEVLEEIRHKFTQVLIAKGFINSGVIIPDQEVIDGVVVLRVVAGGLTSVVVKGNSGYSTGWLEDKLRRGTSEAFNIYTLQKNLQLLQFNRQVQRIHAELKAGERPGESVLLAAIEEHPPLSATLEFSNDSPPATGSYLGELTLVYSNLLGRGDFIEGVAGRAEGRKDYSLRFAVPLNSYDTTVEAYYTENHGEVTEDRFEALDIENNSETWGLRLAQPLYLSMNSQLTMALVGELRRSETYLLDTRFSFSPGVEDGLAKVTVVRATQEYIYRSDVNVFAMASSFNFGIDAFDATIHQDGYADGEFFSWLGQFRYIHQLDNSQLVARLDTQLTNDRLLPMEKFAIGGLTSVRGYRSDYLVRDNGCSGTLEARIPLYGSVNSTGLSVIPFYDFGYARDSSPHAADGEFIHSVGAGLRWSPFESVSAEVFYGHALKEAIDFGDDDPQDDGLHFAFSWTTP